MKKRKHLKDPKSLKAKARALYNKREAEAKKKVIPAIKPVNVRKGRRTKTKASTSLQNVEHKKTFGVMQLRAKKRVTLEELEIKIPPRLMLALQVREERGSSWGNVKAFAIHAATPNSIRDKYKVELEKIKVGWQANGYFGANALFRIREVQGRSSKAVY